MGRTMSFHAERRSVRIHCTSVHVISPVKGDVFPVNLSLVVCRLSQVNQMHLGTAP